MLYSYNSNAIGLISRFGIIAIFGNNPQVVIGIVNKSDTNLLSFS